MDRQTLIPDRAARNGWNAASALLALVVFVAAAPGVEAAAYRRDPAPQRLATRAGATGLHQVSWRAGRVAGAGSGLASRPLPEAGPPAAEQPSVAAAAPALLIRESLLNLPPPALA